MDSRSAEIQLPGERRFGLVFATIFLLIGLWLLFRRHSSWGYPLVVLAPIFAALALLSPGLLRVPNRLWFKLGLLLSRIVSPIVLGLMFLLLITPIALVMRLSGRDALRVRRRSLESYWISRDPPGPEPESFRNQY